jgi:undecaprenyl-diphosphatase
MQERESATESEPQATDGHEMTVSTGRAVRRARWAERVFLVGLAAYAVLAVLAHRYAYFAWDVNFTKTIQSISPAWFETFMVWISALGSGWLPVALVGATGLALMAARFRLEGAILILGVALGGGLNRILKNISDRPRPDANLVNVIRVYDHESFPSGHVVFFIEFFGFLFFLSYVLLKRGHARQALLIVFAGLILLVGVSRVYMGAHWPSDVVGAYLAGGLWLLFMIEVYRRLKSRERAQA